MITKRKLIERLNERKSELNKLDKAYCDFRIGDSQYQNERPILLGQIKELEDLCRINKK